MKCKNYLQNNWFVDFNTKSHRHQERDKNLNGGKKEDQLKKSVNYPPYNYTWNKIIYCYEQTIRHIFQ